MRAVFDIMFVLVPGFSMIALYSALEPLRVANRFGGELFRWRFVSIDGEAVTASNGIPVSVEGSLSYVFGQPLAGAHVSQFDFGSVHLHGFCICNSSSIFLRVLTVQFLHKQKNEPVLKEIHS